MLLEELALPLSQIKGVYPKDDVESFKKDFALLGKNTNKLRDLDVYLLKEKKYMEMLSKDLRPGLNPIFKKLNQQRKSEQKKLSKFLETETYRNILNNFEKYLEMDNLPSDDTPNSGVKIINLAKKFIWKKYSRIIRDGEKINDTSPDPMLHDLRIECKKLRYLLEFFNTLFPQKEMSIIIKHLKKLQDNLGDFNDLYVQQESLKEFLADFKNSDQNVYISVGGLIAVLYQKQKEIRTEFSKSFSELNNDENGKLFKKLFAPN